MLIVKLLASLAAKLKAFGFQLNENAIQLAEGEFS